MNYLKGEKDEMTENIEPKIIIKTCIKCKESIEFKADPGTWICTKCGAKNMSGGRAALVLMLMIGWLIVAYMWLYW